MTSPSICEYNRQMTHQPGRFDHPERAAAYDERIGKILPGYDVLHRMVDVILSAELPEEASLLIVGAGTGHELVLLAQKHPGWRFTAVEPAAPMIAIAKEKLAMAGTSDHVAWHASTMNDFAGEEHFDAATLMMVLHLVPEENQYTLVTDLSDRLNPGSPLVLADIFGDPTTTRYKKADALTKAWAVASGLDQKWIDDVFPPAPRADFHAFTEERLKGWLKEAGFIDVQRFYQAFRVGAWIARANR